ncbi:hypothetical protein TIFTF001_037436 [Ficus carica]|uniref:Uncharacterized protein n=1 Tax=Ficus carica TaxID=3494 RepID=A0AA88E709_FICCA|nr:hypothetical protein TIFTF001_037411 [Ficus carica]GMN68363.1 hypothetical protein TIFTF001_037422 [Ficus carica]GMN68368.1 hypothetical protein TIFTF001_037425 [Ficus carica]GMN68377.1 hypothetical protein TIFTF001_037436 [Ficus carica]
MGENKLSGIIPQSISNASRLQVLDMSVNNFAGQVPASLGGLRELSNLEILSLSVNHFRGVLPISVANLSTKLSYLYLAGNQISGNIPRAIENLANLILLSLEDYLEKFPHP